MNRIESPDEQLQSEKLYLDCNLTVNAGLRSHWLASALPNLVLCQTNFAE
ncbi:MAG: hypothetical protein V7K72_13640 [Nostoc sp.]